MHGTMAVRCIRMGVGSTSGIARHVVYVVVWACEEQADASHCCSAMLPCSSYYSYGHVWCLPLSTHIAYLVLATLWILACPH